MTETATETQSETAEETAQETSKETQNNQGDKKAENTATTADKEGQSPVNENVSKLLAGLSIPMRVPDKDSIKKPVNPFGDKPSEVANHVSERVEDVGDVVETLMEGDGGPVDREAAEMVAETLIEGFDTALAFGGQLAVWEFSDEKDDRYSMPEKRKERLKKPLIKLMMIKGTKISPAWAFGILSFVYILPVIVKIIGDVIEKKKKSKKEDDRRAELENKKENKGGRPKKCKICLKPEKSNQKGVTICKCEKPDFAS